MTTVRLSHSQVLCTSNHLTSFAVLVDHTGVIEVWHWVGVHQIIGDLLLSAFEILIRYCIVIYDVDCQ